MMDGVHLNGDGQKTLVELIPLNHRLSRMKLYREMKECYNGECSDHPETSPSETGN
jgi:hypothetical protein